MVWWMVLVIWCLLLRVDLVIKFGFVVMDNVDYLFNVLVFV